ncbi:MAG TPA: hypothetical protein PLW93_00225 [Candidatus Absconditabacterales bacterium]|nr:hypothetical protein [Candidatus Absconditabacterales bacterium]
MRPQARIEPIKKLLLEAGLFTEEQLAGYAGDLRLAQHLINNGFVEETTDKYWYHDECGVTMEKLGFKRRDFAIRGGYGKNGDEPLQYKIIRDLDDEHIENIIKHMEEKNKQACDGPIRYFSTNQINKFKEELEYRNNASQIINKNTTTVGHAESNAEQDNNPTGSISGSTKQIFYIDELKLIHKQGSYFIQLDNTYLSSYYSSETQINKWVININDEIDLEIHLWEGKIDNPNKLPLGRIAIVYKKKSLFRQIIEYIKSILI